ncbi:hypothetical protein DSM112329_00735 [Paraconexibacter sp. AEG42_29]|uniref:Serine protease n=1 Tax=Paraconexibacter sp. AEG42_29 TaxID=2997339 RepID=A0AAU7AQQ8_9ACTN
MTLSTRLVAIAAVALSAGALATTAHAAPTWAPAGSATVHPGVQTDTAGAGQCTSNFIFTAGEDVYIGQAAHCSGTGGSTETDGCTSKSLPLGTDVTIQGATQPGKLAYNSWITMQEKGEKDPDTCAFNDFALVKVDPADVGKVNPSVPFYGGPVGLSRTGLQVGDGVFSYGNSSLRQGLTLLSPKRGLSLGDDGNGWSHGVVTLTPGVPGDSGSAFLTNSGEALGVLSTLALLPIPGSNGVGDLAKELDYLRANSTIAADLVPGTEPFTPKPIPLDLGGLLG